VEAWDRLGRLRPHKQTDPGRELPETGGEVGVCQLNDVFTPEDLRTHKWIVLSPLLLLAHPERQQKAERGAQSWEMRRQRAREDGGPLGCRLPAWLEPANGAVRLVPERAAAVKRIFALAAAGLGQTRIVKALTQERLPAFGEPVVREGRVRSQFSG